MNPYFFLPDLAQKALEYSLEFPKVAKIRVLHKVLVFIQDPRDIEVTLF
jgi:hypothetical protein